MKHLRHRAGVDIVAGNATLGKTIDGKVILRFENLNSANGPDLHVYLSKQASPSRQSLLGRTEPLRLAKSSEELFGKHDRPASMVTLSRMALVRPTSYPRQVLR